jgi:hypothetical protein
MLLSLFSKSFATLFLFRHNARKIKQKHIVIREIIPVLLPATVAILVVTTLVLMRYRLIAISAHFRRPARIRFQILHFEGISVIPSRRRRCVALQGTTISEVTMFIEVGSIIDTRRGFVFVQVVIIMPRSIARWIVVDVVFDTVVFVFVS